MHRSDVHDRIDRHRKRQAARLSETLTPDNEFGTLYKKALRLYGSRCLWNCSPEPTPDGMMVVAERLKKYGDLRAWYLAAEIKEAVSNAARPPSI